MSTGPTSDLPASAFGLGIMTSTSQTSTAPAVSQRPNLHLTPERDTRLPPDARSSTWVAEAVADWSEVTLGNPPFGKIGKFLKPLVEHFGWLTVRPAWQRYLRAHEVQYLSAARFAETIGQYLRRDPQPVPLYEPDRTPGERLNVAKLRALVQP